MEPRFTEEFWRKENDRNKDEDKKRVVDKRRFTLEDAMNGKLIPMFEGRPKREEVIGKDDIMNLEIALHICASVDKFLEVV